MATLASDALLKHLLQTVPGISYGSISGNYCTDKKATAINGILGRGKNVVTELLVPRDVVDGVLHTSAAKIVELNIRKNLLGTLLAGGIRSANAHYANMLLGFYLATGQDAANIVEGSQGVTMAEDRDGDLYFSCTLPNLIVGTVGNGKGLGLRGGPIWPGSAAGSTVNPVRTPAASPSSRRRRCCAANSRSLRHRRTPANSCAHMSNWNAITRR